MLPAGALLITLLAPSCAETAPPSSGQSPAVEAFAQRLTALHQSFQPTQISIAVDEAGLRLYLLPQESLELSIITAPDSASIIDAARAADPASRFDLTVNSPTYSYKDASGQPAPDMPRSAVHLHGEARFGAQRIGTPAPRRAWLGRRAAGRPLEAGLGPLPDGVDGIGGPAPLLIGGQPLGADRGRPNPELDAQRQRGPLGALTLIGLHPLHHAVLVLSLIAPDASGTTLDALRDALFRVGYPDALLLDPSISTFLVIDGATVANATTPATERQIPYGIHLSSPWPVSPHRPQKASPPPSPG